MESTMRFASLILKNSWRNHRRTLLTVFSIGVSLCLLGMVLLHQAH
jgi:cell division protein FtsX